MAFTAASLNSVPKRSAGSCETKTVRPINVKRQGYFPFISKEDYLKFETGDFMERFHGNSFASLVATLYDGNKIKDSDLDHLAKWLKEKRD